MHKQKILFHLEISNQLPLRLNSRMFHSKMFHSSCKTNIFPFYLYVPSFCIILINNILTFYL